MRTLMTIHSLNQATQSSNDCDVEDQFDEDDQDNDNDISNDCP